MSAKSRQQHVFDTTTRAWIREQVGAMCGGCSPAVKVTAAGHIAVAHAPSCDNAHAIAARGQEIAGQDMRRFRGEPARAWAERLVDHARSVIAGAS